MHFLSQKSPPNQPNHNLDHSKWSPTMHTCNVCVTKIYYHATYKAASKHFKHLIAVLGLTQPQAAFPWPDLAGQPFEQGCYHNEHVTTWNTTFKECGPSVVPRSLLHHTNVFTSTTRHVPNHIASQTRKKSTLLTITEASWQPLSGSKSSKSRPLWPQNKQLQQCHHLCWIRLLCTPRVCSFFGRPGLAKTFYWPLRAPAPQPERITMYLGVCYIILPF